MLMSGEDYRESLRRYRPKVYLDGSEVASVADEPRLAPGVNAIALTYDYALREDLAPLMRAGDVNRMLAVPRSTDDLLNKLEAVRLVCQQTGCAQRYLVGDAFAAILSGGWYSVISLHGGGSPEAMKMEIWRNYPVGNKVDLVERLMDRGVLSEQVRSITRNRQPGRCCVQGCMLPLPDPKVVSLHKKKA